MLALTVVGCASNVARTNLDEPRYFPDEMGVVALQVVSNVRQLAPRIDAWAGVRLENLDDEETEYYLHKVRKGLVGSDFFLGALPPGQYRLKELVAGTTAGETFYGLSAPLPESLSTFTIENDKLSDLGTLAYQPFGSFPTQSELSEDDPERSFLPFAVVRVPSDSEFHELVSELYPHVSARIDPGSRQGWDRPAESGSEMAEVIRRHVVPGSAIHPTHGGPVLPSRLGQIYRFDSDTETWQRSDTGVNHMIGYVATTPAGGLLAVGERGLVLESEGWGSPWRRLRGPGPTHEITWAHVRASGDRIILTRTSEFIHLLRSGPGSPSWEPIHRFNVHYGWRSKGRQVAFAHVEAEKLIVLAEGRYHEFDFGGELLDRRLARRFMNIAMQPNGYLVIESEYPSVDPRYSIDGGRDWIAADEITDEESWITGGRELIYVDAEGAEWAVSNKPQIKGDFWRRKHFPHEPHLRRKYRWSRQVQWHGSLPEGCEELDPTLSVGGTIFVRCFDGRLMSTRSSGDIWTLELDPTPSSTDGAIAESSHRGEAEFTIGTVTTVYIPIYIPAF